MKSDLVFPKQIIIALLFMIVAAAYPVWKSGSGQVVAAVLIVLLMVQALREAYYSPEPVKFSHRTRLSTVLLLAIFGVGMLLRILQMQALSGH